MSKLGASNVTFESISPERESASFSHERPSSRSKPLPTFIQDWSAQDSDDLSSASASTGYLEPAPYGHLQDFDDVAAQMFGGEAAAGPSKSVTSPGEVITSQAWSLCEAEWQETLRYFWRNNVFHNLFYKVGSVHMFNEVVMTLGQGFPFLTILSDVLKQSSGSTVIRLLGRLRKLRSNLDVILFFTSIESMGSVLIYELGTHNAESKTKSESHQRDSLKMIEAQLCSLAATLITFNKAFADVRAEMNKISQENKLIIAKLAPMESSVAVEFRPPPGCQSMSSVSTFSQRR